MNETARATAPRFTARHVGLLVVVFALLVQAPRLTLTFIMSDGLELDQQVEFWIMVGSAIAGAVVLTLGNAYLTHALAARFQRHDPLSWLLSVAWVIYLLFTTVIIAPSLMVGIRNSPLAEVLPHLALQWAWCVIVAVSFEFLVAGSMAAYAMASRVQPAPVAVVNIPLAPALHPQPDETRPVTPGEPVQLDALDRRIIEAYRRNPALSDTKAASEAGTTRPTLKKRLDRLQAAGLAHVNGVVSISANGNGNGAHA